MDLGCFPPPPSPPELFNRNQTGIWEIKEIWKTRGAELLEICQKKPQDKIKAVNTYWLLRGNFLQCFIKGYLLPVLSILNSDTAKPQQCLSICPSFKYRTTNWLSLTTDRQTAQDIALLLHICWLQESLTTFLILPSPVNAGYRSSDTLGDPGISGSISVRCLEQTNSKNVHSYQNTFYYLFVTGTAVATELQKTQQK